MEQSTGQPVEVAPVETPVSPPVPDQERHGSNLTPPIWIGLGLVVLGALLLVGQLLPSMQLWLWWPLILVGIGIRQMFGSQRQAWSVRHLGEGLTTVALGLVLLGQMLGMLRWDVWLNIIKLWPVLFISVGLEIIGKATRTELPRFFGSLVIVTALAYGALVLTPQAGWPPVSQVAGGERFEHVEQHRRSVTDGSAKISGAIGKLTVRGGDDLVRASGKTPFNPVFDVSILQGRAIAEINSGEGSWIPLTPASELTVALDRVVAWDLVVDAGVSDYNIDLSEVLVTALALESGVSNGVLTLGDPGAAGPRGVVPVEIDAGVSAMVVRVPQGTDARITINEGLSGTTAEGQWTRGRAGDGRTYESDGFSGDGAYWDVRIDSGVGSITLQYY